MFCAITFLHIILVSGWPLDVKIAPQMLVSLWGCLGNRSWCSRTWAGPTVSRFPFPSIPCCLLFLSRRKTLLGQRRFFVWSSTLHSDHLLFAASVDPQEKRGSETPVKVSCWGWQNLLSIIYPDQLSPVSCRGFVWSSLSAFSALTEEI